MWCQGGYGPAEFWSTPPRLIRSAIDGYFARLKEERVTALMAAWQGARQERLKHMDQLPTVLELAETKPKRKANSAKAWHEAKVWAARTGAKLTISRRR